MTGTLYLVGVPIGNTGDLSPRAEEILRRADFVLAEDPRVTKKLLEHFGIFRETLRYYEHNKLETAAVVIPRLLAGETGALVSDAGMPAIADPGETLVKLCAEQGIRVSAIPGPSALITALALSGLPTQRFTFEGFLSTSVKSRGQHLESLRHEKRTMVIYEAPHKLKETLTDLLKTLGDRDCALCRELTKVNEEVLRTTLSGALRTFEEDYPRGEYVLVIRGEGISAGNRISLEEAAETALRYMEEGMEMEEASRKAAAETGQSTRDLFHALRIASEKFSCGQPEL